MTFLRFQHIRILTSCPVSLPMLLTIELFEVWNFHWLQLAHNVPFSPLAVFPFTTIAIEGCCHGQLDDIYGSIRLVEEKENCKIDLVLICGDFQAIRNESDMYCMAVPPKYRNLGTFWKYYTGQARAPYPTIFIGGNHEASNYLWELYHGGWVCDNIYYLGHAGVIEFGGLRIGGL
ncbi:lariat debranching enzyme, partial [Rhizopus stolonifer]